MRALTTTHTLAVVLSSLSVSLAQDFTIAVLPDTQNYTTSDCCADVFSEQTQWIRDHRIDQNIVFAIHEGDIVNCILAESMTAGTPRPGEFKRADAARTLRAGCVPDVVPESATPDSAQGRFDRADAAMTLLDGFVPYVLAVGNHDMGDDLACPGASSRDTSFYSATFPYSRYASEPWYGGRLVDADNNNDNYYVRFTASGMKFLILSLEFNPTDATLSWANDVVSSHCAHRVIVVTHSYLTKACDVTSDPGCDPSANGRCMAEGDPLCSERYEINADGANDGEEIWNEFIKWQPNIFLVLCGHIHGSGQTALRLTSTGVHGNPVHQVMANYQSGLPAPYDGAGGNGFLRLMTFRPAENLISVDTYSPWVEACQLGVTCCAVGDCCAPNQCCPTPEACTPGTATFLADATNQFDLVYDMQTPHPECCTDADCYEGTLCSPITDRCLRVECFEDHHCDRATGRESSARPSPGLEHGCCMWDNFCCYDQPAVCCDSR